MFLYLKNASRHNVPKSKLGKQGSNLINTTNYITIRYEEPISFFNSDHLGIGRCKWRSYTKYHFIKLFFFATWKPRIRTASVRKSISLQRSESMDFRFITTVLRSSGNSSRSKLDSYLAIQWRLLPENHILVHLFLKSSFREVAIGTDLF